MSKLSRTACSQNNCWIPAIIMLAFTLSSTLLGETLERIRPYMKISTMFLSNSFSQLWKLLIVLLLSFGLFMLSHGSVQARSTSCASPSCTNVGFYFDGAFRNANGWGADAIIGDYQVTTNCISSSTWTLIGNQSYNDALSQDGYVRLYTWSNSVTYYFYEYGSTSQLYNPVMLSVMKKGWGSSDTFSSYYNSGNGYIEELINGVVQVYIHVDWNSNQQQWAAEVHSNEDHVVGGYNHHSIFATDRYLYNGVWYTINTPSYVSNSTPYGSYSASGGTFYVWDTWQS